MKFVFRLKFTDVLLQANDTWIGKRGILYEQLLIELIGKCSSKASTFLCEAPNLMKLDKT